MNEILETVIARNRDGRGVAIPSVCTAHFDVLVASLRLASRIDRAVVVEATSNQVNQYGGYTGMAPADFMQFATQAARLAGADMERVVLGGDHLGTQVWRAQDADLAMRNATDLVAGYVRAGFEKIHLDCSEGCRGEPAQLSDAAAAERSATLAEACLKVSGGRPLTFVVGTEVPPPGGARSDEEGDIAATSPQNALATLEAHRAAFQARGIGEAVAMIGGLVVQPGVEFSPTHVHHLPLHRDPGILAALRDWPGTCLEAHSTDYQRPEAFPRLAKVGFAFQKVGPALTFAWRQAVYGLDALRVMAGRGEPIVMPVMEALMTEHPAFWAGHYRGDTESLRLQRHFGLADRVRYYWPQERARQAVDALFVELGERPLPPILLRQMFAETVIERAEEIDLPQAQAIAAASVETALLPYFF